MITIRVFNAFRTTSDEVVLVVAVKIPIDILAKDVTVLYHVRCMEDHKEPRNAAKPQSYDFWQRRCDGSSKGRWMHRFMPNIRV